MLQVRATKANLTITKMNDSFIIQGYMGKAKGALQIACKQGFMDMDGLLWDGQKA